MSEHGIDCDPACRCDANIATGRGTSEYTPTVRHLIRAGYWAFIERDPSAFQEVLAIHDAQVKADAWDEGYGEPRECCGHCPLNSCPWDKGGRGPRNPYRIEAEVGDTDDA